MGHNFDSVGKKVASCIGNPITLRQVFKELNGGHLWKHIWYLYGLYVNMFESLISSSQFLGIHMGQIVGLFSIPLSNSLIITASIDPWRIPYFTTALGPLSPQSYPSHISGTLLICPIGHLGPVSILSFHKNFRVGAQIDSLFSLR